MKKTLRILAMSLILSFLLLTFSGCGESKAERIRFLETAISSYDKEIKKLESTIEEYDDQLSEAYGLYLKLHKNYGFSEAEIEKYREELSETISKLKILRGEKEQELEKIKEKRQKYLAELEELE